MNEERARRTNEASVYESFGLTEEKVEMSKEAREDESNNEETRGASLDSNHH